MTFIRFDRTDLKVDDLLHGDVNLASPPEIYARLCHLLDRPDATLAMMAEVIEHDPALAARLLRLVNSAFFSLPRSVHGIAEAVTLIGIRELKQFVLATEVIRQFEGIPPDLIDIYAFWRQSMRCAVLARLLAGRRRPPMDADGIFIAALLHGIGHLVIYARLPELGRKTLLEHRHRGQPLHEVQREYIGFDYAEIGSALARMWKLPDMLCTVLACHLHPALADAYGPEAALVCVALKASQAEAFVPAQVTVQVPETLPEWQQAGLGAADLEAVLPQAEQDFTAALALLR